MYRVHSPTSEATNDEVLNMFNKDINLEYAKISRFNGKVISMGKEGQAICYSEITKRLDETNIDRTAMSLSSNDCENFFGMITRYSHGKRIFWGNQMRGKCINS